MRASTYAGVFVAAAGAALRLPARNPHTAPATKPSAAPIICPPNELSGGVADHFGNLDERLNLRPLGEPSWGGDQDNAGGTTREATAAPSSAPESAQIISVFMRSRRADAPYDPTRIEWASSSWMSLRSS